MENITVVVTPENNSFQGKRTVIVNQPIIIGRQTDQNETPAPNGLKFNSKVVSRQHARLSHQDGKFYLQDTKSSSGTFVNGERLSPQGVESRQCELHDGDIIKLGEDFSQGDVVTHQSVLMRIKLPNRPDSDETFEDDPYVDLAMDSEVRAEVDDEFNTIWNSLVADINTPLKRLRNVALLANSAAAAAGTASGATVHVSPKSTQYATLSRNDATVTIRGTISNSQVASPGALSDALNSAVTDAATALECATLVESLQWEPDLKGTLLDLCKKQDQQLLAFYKSLKAFPSQFNTVASKYAKYARSKKI